MTSPETADLAQGILRDLEGHIQAAVERVGTTEAIKPSHRIPFHWPPHPVSADYHVLNSEWTGKATLETHGETLRVLVARTPYGVFGRCEDCWAEARGDTLDSMLAGLERAIEPLYARRQAIATTIGLDRPFKGRIRDLTPGQLVQLLYCEDRDVANEARIEIETHASMRIFTPALIRILRDDRHPHRRIAQWCVLDLFEDLPSFCSTLAEQQEAIEAIKVLIWDAKDDFARTVFKAGVVLGGHVANDPAKDALLECVFAPSRIGRRAAIHGAFHLAEWLEPSRQEVVAALRKAASEDPEPRLREFARHMADDIERGEVDHIVEPVFEDEL